jgi:proton-dependent oligopeptide transporter, POT family
MLDTPVDFKDKDEFFGHPKGLYILFLTEMWERFSFYGMKVLLIFYLVKYHLFSDQEGNLLVGSYAALVYAMPVIGGYLADRYLGFRKAVLFGGICLVLGHIGMAYEGNAATAMADGTITRDNGALSIFYFSLSLIILGVGFLKANISSIVGELYSQNDMRRDSGFTIFYMGINLGSFLSTLLCSWLGETYGWGYGFAAAGVGMFLGLITFVWGRKYFSGKGEAKDPIALQAKVLGPISQEWLIYILSILSLGIIWIFIQDHHLVENMLIWASISSLIFIIYQLTISEKIARDRLIALTVLTILSVVFWALFEQAYTSMNLFSERSVDRHVFGTELAAGTFLSLNALFIVGFAPIFAWIWTWLDKKDMQPNTFIKFGLAIVFAGLGFGFLVLGGKGAIDGKVLPIWLVLAYLFHSWGELCLSPVGLSAVTKLSPARIVGFMMGVWFLATAAAEYVAALLANLASIQNTTAGEVTDVVAATQSYSALFYQLFAFGTVIGLVVLLISPLLKRLMHGVK